MLHQTISLDISYLIDISTLSYDDLENNENYPTRVMVKWNNHNYPPAVICNNNFDHRTIEIILYVIFLILSDNTYYSILLDLFSYRVQSSLKYSSKKKNLDKG